MTDEPKKGNQPRDSNSNRTKRRKMKRHGKEDRDMEKRGRLPDGSKFVAVYSDVGRRWSGALVVATADGPREFPGTGAGVFSLMRNLDRAYRGWLADQKEGEIIPRPSLHQDVT